MEKQVIHSRFEYPKTKTTSAVFEEYRNMFENRYNEDGVVVWGVTAAIAADRRVILLTYCEEADVFLKLKFYGMKNVDYRKLI